MTYYIKTGESFHPSKEGSLDIQNKLPGGNYLVKITPQGVLYFERTETMPDTGKLYGDVTTKADRIMTTFKSRTVSTGVMLAGEKGCGKTMLAKVLSSKCKEEGMPCIIINNPWTGDGFNELIQGLQQPCMILFDEFEKVYDNEHQEAILTLLDGVFSTKKLFVFTCNNKNLVNVNMQNRPGRIFYMIDYKGLDIGFIEEYCNDVLDNKLEIPFICRASSIFEAFNFDMLKALVEEMNRYKESAMTSLQLLNAKPEFGSQVEYDLSLSVDGMPVDNIWPVHYVGNPMSLKRLNINVQEDNDDDDLDIAEVVCTATSTAPVPTPAVTKKLREYYGTSSSDLISMDTGKGEFVFKAEESGIIKFTRVVHAPVNPYLLM